MYLFPTPSEGFDKHLSNQSMYAWYNHLLKWLPWLQILSLQSALKLLIFLKMLHSPTTCLLRHNLSCIQVTTSYEVLQVVLGGRRELGHNSKNEVLSSSSKMLHKKLSELITDFSKVAEYKINIQKPVVFLYIDLVF